MHWKSQLIEVATGVKFGFKLIQEMQIYIHLGESSTAGIYILLQLSMSIFLKIDILQNSCDSYDSQYETTPTDTNSYPPGSKVRIYLSIFFRDTSTSVSNA